MPTAKVVLRLEGQAVPPYVGEWKLISRQRFPDAEYDWDDAQLFTADAQIGEELTLDDALCVEQMIREQTIEEGGAPLESLIYSRLEGLPTGEARFTYRVHHAAHASPIVWAAIVAWIAAHWVEILIILGLAAATVAAITFMIKSTSIIWKAGGKIEDLIEELPPALVGLGAGLLILLLAFTLGGKKETRKEEAK